MAIQVFPWHPVFIWGHQCKGNGVASTSPYSQISLKRKEHVLFLNSHVLEKNDLFDYT